MIIQTPFQESRRSAGCQEAEQRERTTSHRTRQGSAYVLTPTRRSHHPTTIRPFGCDAGDTRGLVQVQASPRAACCVLSVVFMGPNLDTERHSHGAGICAVTGNRPVPARTDYQYYYSHGCLRDDDGDPTRECACVSPTNARLLLALPANPLAYDWRSEHCTQTLAPGIAPIKRRLHCGQWGTGPPRWR